MEKDWKFRQMSLKIYLKKDGKPGGIGGGVGKWFPSALNPFSSAMYVTVIGWPSAIQKKKIKIKFELNFSLFNIKL